MFVVTHLSSLKPSVEFETIQQAEDYVRANSCELCRNDLKRGGYYYENDYIVVKNIMDTACGAEYSIEKKKEIVNV